MKKAIVYLCMATALLASCSPKEEYLEFPVQDDAATFFASFEQPGDLGTKVYATEDLLLRWTADDRVSIFDKNTYNQQYKFAGKTGDNAGEFSKVDNAVFVTGNSISDIVSVYPYQKATAISESEVISFTLPAEQAYAENTFGLGANTMVSVSSGNFLQFKNVGGYLRLSLYGEGVSVSAVTLRGNNGEKLAGKASITMPLDGVPTVKMAEDATTDITLVCDTPVSLGATPEESTQFWFVVPPVTFEKGFTLTIRTQAGVSVKSTTKSLSIKRSNVSKMSAFEVDFSQPNNVIYYTSSDGNVVTPYAMDVFGANIVSNEYVDGQGIITFDGAVTSLGDMCFLDCSSLTSIRIPDSVISLGVSCFYYCRNLTSITIPDGVTSLGYRCFSDCNSLTSVTIPDSVTLLGDECFRNCTGLTSITIPDGVTSLGRYCFADCSSLTSITIPDGVTSLGLNCFADCSSLTSITIPNSVTSLGGFCFYGCSGLTSITIPDSVTSLAQGCFGACNNLESFDGKFATSDGRALVKDNVLIAFAPYGLTSYSIPDGMTSLGNACFAGCSSLTNITIPDSVTSLGGSCFADCRSLTSITIPEGVTSLGLACFADCRSLTSITIPSSVTSLGASCFLYCSSLTSITVMPAIPPTGGSGMFSTNTKCPIYVPAGSVDAYKTARYWSDYEDRIQAISE